MLHTVNKATAIRAAIIPAPEVTISYARTTKGEEIRIRGVAGSVCVETVVVGSCSETSLNNASTSGVDASCIARVKYCFARVCCLDCKHRVPTKTNNSCARGSSSGVKLRQRRTSVSDCARVSIPSLLILASNQYNLSV